MPSPKFVSGKSVRALFYLTSGLFSVLLLIRLVLMVVLFPLHSEERKNFQDDNPWVENLLY